MIVGEMNGKQGNPEASCLHSLLGPDISLMQELSVLPWCPFF